jgi:Putative adhesin
MHVYETPGSVELEIELPAGDVTVRTADEPATTVELIPKGRRGQEAVDQIEVTHRERPGGHVVTIEQHDRIRWGPIAISWGGDVEVRVTCPTGADIELDGGSTDLSAIGSFGKVVAKTASGDLRLGATREALIKTASGDVSLQSLASESAITTVSGDVEVELVEGSLNARTVSGDVELGRVRSSVTLGTTSGDIAVEAVEAGELRVQSTSGDARIGVAQGTPVWMDATSVSGDLDSELGVVEDAPAGEGDVVPLHVKTVSGDVRFVRAAALVAE